MNNTKSKVLIIEDSEECRIAIKLFCDQNDLLGLVSREEDLLTVLKSYVDLGAVFISKTIQHQNKSGLDLVAEIHYIRPELPIFFRCSTENVKTYQNIFLNKGICCAYQVDEIEELKGQLKTNIFNQEYPNALLRGIEEIATRGLESFFTDVNIEYSAPYLVNDRIIYGELLSLIPVESDWCKGYMMLQTTQDDFLDLVAPGKISGIQSDDFRSVNDILSELTNMIWGGIKARFIAEGSNLNISQTQIPIIINHTNRYITFGSSTPHLCFQYTLKSKKNEALSLCIFHKFIFNVNWAPELFKDSPDQIEDYLESGALEFF